MSRDDLIFVYHLACNHFTRGARVAKLLPYLTNAAWRTRLNYGIA